MFVRAREFALATLSLGVCFACFSVTASAQSAAPTFKVAYFNIQSGKGEQALPGHPATFTENTNCTDPSLPMNAWGTGLIQAHLTASVGNDPKVIALGLGEAWSSTCGSPERVRQALGWKARTGEQNGVAMVVRHGFAGPQEWLQLDTSLNPNPKDTMWVVRAPVCLDAGCAQSVDVFVAHWLGSETETGPASLDRQGRQTTEFLKLRGGQTPHVFVGDLNAWEGTRVCSQNPEPSGLSHLRDAGYIDAWPALHGAAEGYTGMVNRANCGIPMGYPFKRIDYAWTPPGFAPLAITRFAMVPAGDGAPSDHYGIIAEYPWPGVVPPPDLTPPAVLVTAPLSATIVSGPVRIAASATDASGIARVEILEDGQVAHTLTSSPYEVICDHLWRLTEGAHAIAARAVDGAGRAGTSAPVSIAVTRSTTPGGADVVLHAKDATVIQGTWLREPDPSAAGGARMYQPDLGAPKLAVPSPAPADHFELTFQAQAGIPYRLWLRGAAAQNHWNNDSVYVQFSGSVTETGLPTWRIGSPSATTVVLEDCSGCGLNGWGWADSGYGTGVLGPPVYFAASGPQTIRIQGREDGISIDQVVISNGLYLTRSPGAPSGDATILPPTTAPPPVPVPPVNRAEIVLRTMTVPIVAGAWRVVPDATAAGGAALAHANTNAPRVPLPLATPQDFFELTFDAEGGRPYRLWLRGRADDDLWSSDSVFVQFSGSVSIEGEPVDRIGTSSATSVNLEDGSGVGIQGWGWQDNGYGIGVLGPLVIFETTGRQTIRIQTREDGLRIDQIVLSAAKYLTAAPGALKNDGTILP
jgi:hypothetical protein